MFVSRRTLQNYDPFKKLKDKAFDDSRETMVSIAKYLILQFSKKEVDNSKLLIQFIQILKVCILLFHLSILLL